jgi:hypothetical protein
MRTLALFALLAAAALPASAQKYKGPLPPAPDTPYLLHASKLVPTDSGEASEEKRKDGTAYVTKGAEASAKTPLAEPIFLFESKKIFPERLALYKLEVKNGNREVFFYENPKKRKDGAQAFRLSVEKMATNVYRLEATEPLPNGEYALTPEGVNTVFCFTIY